MDFSLITKASDLLLASFQHKVSDVGSSDSVQVTALMSYRAQVLQSFGNYERRLHNDGHNHHINIWKQKAFTLDRIDFIHIPQMHYCFIFKSATEHWLIDHTLRD